MELNLIGAYIGFIVSPAILGYVLYRIRKNMTGRQDESQAREAAVLALSEAQGKASTPHKVSVLAIDANEFQHRVEVIEGTLSVYTKTAIFCATTGDITVQGGGALLLYGICAGNIVVNARGSAAIYGTVVGSVTNNGGELHVFGKIIGGLHGSGAQTSVHSVAQVLEREKSP